MTEPDVALTDYFLALEGGLFAVILARGTGGDPAIRRWFVVFFAAVALASLAGGTVHGFFLEARSAGYRILWPLSLLAIGLASVAGWNAAARAGLSATAARRAVWAAGLVYPIYAGAVLLLVQDFALALVAYLPASVFLLLVFLREARQTHSPAAARGALGLMLTFVGGAVQQLQVAAHPVYLTHNALYHAILAVALALLFHGVRWLIGRSPEARWSQA